MMMSLLIMEEMGAMVVSFGLLLKEHNAGDRRIAIAFFRQTFCDVDPRTWQGWRDRCGCKKFARHCSWLSALKLWILASANGRKNDNEVRLDVIHHLEKNSESVERWLTALTRANESVGKERRSLHRDVVSAIAERAPDIVIRRRASLYEWFDRAGYSYSTGKEYSQQQLDRVIAEARKSQQRSRRREERSAC